MATINLTKVKSKVDNLRVKLLEIKVNKPYNIE